MKLLLENWRKYITEDWRDTSWKNDEDEVTIGEVVDYLGDKTVDINVRELVTKLPTLPIGGGDVGEALNRMSAASLEFPIIVVKFGGEYQFVLDGNHRLGKAFVCGDKEATIKAKILDVSAEAETPERFKKMFG
jgi:hypothetical protein